MGKISKEIFNKLNSDMKYVKQIYGEENFFIIFSYDNDTKVEAVVIPNFEDVCLNEPLINGLLHNNNHDIIVRDIRFAYHATRDGFNEMINAIYTDKVIVNPKYEHFYIKMFKTYRDAITAGVRSGIPAPELKMGIVKLMRCAFNDNSKTIQFIKQTTDAEKLALIGVIEKIGDEGTVSLSKVSSAIGVSRLTMTNLIAKMETFNVAKIENMGPRGTYIKIIDSAILDIKGGNTYA